MNRLAFQNRSGHAAGTARARGFTLVEILIVVIILGILAAIVLPKFANASGDARRSTLFSTLHSLRGQIEFYMLQHGDTPPALTTSDWSPLTTQSTFSGQNYGPYIPMAPTNPLNGHWRIEIVAADAVGGDAISGANVGFVYNPNNGKLWASNSTGTLVFNEVNPLDPAN